MQYRPDAPTLLAAVAEVLDDVLPEVAADKQHHVRVAAHLSRLVEREVRLGGEVDIAERTGLAELLDAEVADTADGAEQLAARLRELDHDEAFDAAAWRLLVGVTRRDLEIAKPGHADWTGT